MEQIWVMVLNMSLTAGIVIVAVMLVCALRRTFLKGESPKSALVVGRIQPNTKGVHREVESEGRCRQISGLTNRNHIRL